MDILHLLDLLKDVTADTNPPMSVLLIRDFGKDPFIILIACLLSLRARDTVTYPISLQLFKRARTPEQLLGISQKELQALIKPIGFYQRKADTLRRVCAQLIEQFHGKVPHNEKDLLSLYGVGHKTAALVLAEAFDKPAICVDTHVHKIANALGFVHTKTPEQTEIALKKIVPQNRWKEVNRLFVTWGQNKKALAPRLAKYSIKI